MDDLFLELYLPIIAYEITGYRIWTGTNIIQEVPNMSPYQKYG